MDFHLRTIRRVFILVGLYLLGINGCSDQENAVGNSSTPRLNGESVDIWSIPNTSIDTVRCVSRLSVESADTLGASALGYIGVPRGFVAADSLGFILSDLRFGMLYPEARAYGWDLSLQWVFVDSSAPAPLFPILGRACAYGERQVLLSTSSGDGWMYLLDRDKGDLQDSISLSHLSSEQVQGSSSSGAPVARSLSVSDSIMAAGWSYASFGSVDFCASILAMDGREVTSFSYPHVDGEASARECPVALVGEYCAVAMPTQDLIVMASSDGNVNQAISCGHSAVIPFLSPSVAGPNVTIVSPVIADIQSDPSGRLWILYGPGAFPTDSSELWVVAPGTMEASVLPISSLATGFAVWEDRVVIQTRGKDRNLQTDSWSDPENRVLVVDLEAIE